ncbi:hypothetical protein N7457_006639 [Penicillium paradoxum]|uniref:uncharacterized protein n=1 Tax=Penicillium paradoxum TaxID=176176 RepID=UPI002549A1B2|nr:uncharacterized protein N7457_006639 [Penicillium paradoxum]KAJ5778919.1 hypothetical protein N7457_006639 [Penicillium paradoxum]
MHIYRDLSPYVCTFEHCQNADQQYDSLHDWIEHEVASHSNADERTTYIRAYNDTLSKAPAKATGRICPFCCIGSASPTHIAWHLRRVASFALPRLAESESRDESDSRNSAAADFDSDDTYSDGSIELLEEDTPLRRYSSKTSQDSEEERYREDYSSSSEGSNQPDLHKHRDMANEQSKKTSGSPDSNQAVHGASQTSGRSHRANSGLSSPRSNSPQPSIIQRRFSNSDAEEDNMTLKLNGLSIGFTSEAVEGESIGIGPGGGVRLNITSGKRPRPNSREPRVSRENSPFSRDNEQVIGHDMPEGSDIQLGMGRLQKEIDPAREQFERGRKEFVEDRPDSRISWGNREEAELDEEKIAAGLHKLQHFERKDQSEEEQRNAEERYQRKKLADKRAAAEEEEKRAGHNPREERLEDTTRKHDEESQRAKFMREEKWKELARIQEEEEEREKLIQEIRDEDMRKAREAEEKRRKEMAMRAAAVEEWKQEQERMKQRMTEEAMRKATEFRVRLRSIGYTEEEIDAIINKETEERTREEKKQAKHTQETLDEAMQKAWEIGKKEQTATEAASAENGQTSPERNTLGLPHGGDSIQNVWWCCCQCNSLANPKLAEKQCPICAHHHCSACKSELVPP